MTLSLWIELAFCGFEFDLTNAPILLPVAPHSEGCEFPPEIDKYRGIVEDAVFDRLGRPSFFDGAVEVVMERIAARMEQQHPGTATSEEAIRGAIHWEARKPRREIEGRFMATGSADFVASWVRLGPVLFLE